MTIRNHSGLPFRPSVEKRCKLFSGRAGVSDRTRLKTGKGRQHDSHGSSGVRRTAFGSGARHGTGVQGRDQRQRRLGHQRRRHRLRPSRLRTATSTTSSTPRTPWDTTSRSGSTRAPRSKSGSCTAVSRAQLQAKGTKTTEIGDMNIDSYHVYFEYNFGVAVGGREALHLRRPGQHEVRRRELRPRRASSIPPSPTARFPARRASRPRGAPA